MTLTDEEKAKRFDHLADVYDEHRKLIQSGTVQRDYDAARQWFSSRCGEIIDADAPDTPAPKPSPTLTDQEIRRKAVELLALAHSTRDGSADLSEIADKLAAYIETGES